MTAHVMVYAVGGVHPPFDDVEVVRTEAEHEVNCMSEVFITRESLLKSRLVSCWTRVHRKAIAV
jgi:hypothetical protein